MRSYIKTKAHDYPKIDGLDMHPSGMYISVFEGEDFLVIANTVKTQWDKTMTRENALFEGPGYLDKAKKVLLSLQKEAKLFRQAIYTQTYKVNNGNIR